MRPAKSAMEDHGWSPFLGIQHGLGSTRKYDHTYAKLSKESYVEKTPSNLSMIARNGRVGGKKRRAVHFAQPDIPHMEAVPTMELLNPVLMGDHLKGKMDEDEDEKKALDPAEIEAHEAKNPIKKNTKLPGHTLVNRIFKQIETQHGQAPSRR